MSKFNSFAMCIIMVIYLSLFSAAPSLTLMQRVMNANNLSTAIDTAVHHCANCPARASNDPACPLDTYKLLLQSFISNSNLLKPKKRIRDDYLLTPNVGRHKLHTRSVPWHVGRRICREEGGHLAIINSRDEARLLAELLNNAGYIKGAAQPNIANIGIHSHFAPMEWVTVLDDALTATGFNKWSDQWGGQPDNAENENCGTYVLEDEGLADVNCSMELPFFCELPIEEN
ncbi:hemolymph lipopolysaccharide-binding protein-like [Lasioglossum baleicum]|uniref:hemolymph lipopolysaccharide-binding protein-like n=1 Tax=Lasioglossum baleicum TaxID=434251 RepID=UPI003FCCCBBB